MAATASPRYADVQEHLDPEGEEINLRHTISAHLDHVPLKPGRCSVLADYSSRVPRTMKDQLSAARRYSTWEKP